MPKRIVSRIMDAANPPRLSAAQQAEVKRLAESPEREIDFSDIPRLTPEFFSRAVRNPFCKPTKITATVRIDSDVLLWFRSQGKDYQARINAILRREMQALK